MKKIEKKAEIVYDGIITLSEKLLEENGKRYISITLYTSDFLTEPNNYFKAFENIFDSKHLELSYPKQKIKLAATEKDCLTTMFPLGFRGKFEGQDVNGRIAAEYMHEGDSVRIDVEYENAPNKRLLSSIGKMLLKIKPDISYINERKGYWTWGSVINKEEEPDIFGMNPRNFDGIKLPFRC